MKTVPAKKLKTNLDDVLKSSQKERIVISRAGKPCAVLVGIEDYDEEDLQLASSRDFWLMIRERRSKGKSIPLADVEEHLKIHRRKTVRRQTSARKLRSRR
jgi:prevent-host-death family protein